MPSRIIRILMLTTLLWTAPALAQESNSGKIDASTTRWCAMPQPGIVRDVLVAPGETVRAGQPLISYSLQPQVRHQLDTQLQAGAESQELEMRLLDVQYRMLQLDEKLEAARRLATAGVGTDVAIQRLHKDRNLLESQRRLIQTSIRHQQDVRAARLRDMEMTLGTTLANGRIPEILQLTSPIDGQVQKLDPCMVPGMAFAPLASAVIVGVMDPVRIHTLVFEKEMVTLKVGDTARAEIPSLGNRELTATITRINQAPVRMALDQASYYEVDLEAANPEHTLITGLKTIIYFQNQQNVDQ